MGSLPALSILKGPNKPLLNSSKEPLLLHRILENTIALLEENNNSNGCKHVVHSVDLTGRSAQDTVLIFGNRRTTISRMNEAANQLARAMLHRLHGAQKNCDGDAIVAVCMPPSDVLIITLLAVWKIGAAYLPLDATFPVNRIHHILDESQPVLVITDQHDPDTYGNYTSVTYEELVQASNGFSEENLHEDSAMTGGVTQDKSLAIILYTSGSTGVPKGVRLPHSVILNRLKWQWRMFPYSATETTCVFKTALTFVDSVAEIWGPLLCGLSVLVISKEDTKNPETLVAILEKYQIERLVLVPTLLRAILLYVGMLTNDRTPFRPNDTVITREHLSRLRWWICSGEPLPVSLAKKFYQYFDHSTHTLCNFYGSTEVMGDVTYHAITGFDELAFQDKVPIGKPVDNTVIYILDKRFRPVSTGQVGELFVSGLNLAAGYVKGRDPAKFVDNPLAVDVNHIKLYRTGDYASIIKGVLYFEGRTDSQVKVRGHRVDLSEIEAAMTRVESVDKSVVLCYKPGEVEQALLMFYSSSLDVSEPEVEDCLQKTLAPYMVPQPIRVNAIPLLVNGKVDRQTLLKSYEQNFKKDPDVEPTFNYTGISPKRLCSAKALFETVAAVLGNSLRSEISSTSNFYHLGGNSLNSVYAVTKLRDLGYVIGIGEFISAPTLGDIVTRMRSEDTSTEESIISLTHIPKNKYKVEMLREEFKDDVFEIISTSFYEKADLEQWLDPKVPRECYYELLEALWPHLLDKNFSFAIKNSAGKIVATAFNFDGHDEPEISLTSKLVIVFDFLEFIEAPIRDHKLPVGKGQVLHSFMMGTHQSLSAQDNIELMVLMEQEVLAVARQGCFAGVFTTNTSPLTQQLGADVYDYQELLNYQVNKYIAPDNTRPFGEAPDSQRAVVSWKIV